MFDKVKGAGVGGAVTVILVWIIARFLQVEVPPEVAASLTLLISIIVGYFVPEKSGYSRQRRASPDPTRR